MLKKALIYIYRNSPYIVAGIITTLYITLALLRHYHFKTYGYDLAIYDQTVWLYSRFIYPFVTVEYKFALLNHFSPSLALFAPLYWIWSDPQVLLIAQAVMIGASAIPINKLAQKLKLPTYLRTVLVISYLTFYGYQFSVDFDVHSVVFGTTFIPWLILAIENREYKKAAILMAIMLGMKESFPVITFAIGIIYFLRGRRKVGMIISALSIAYMITVLKILFPLMESFTNEYYRFSSSNPSSITDIFSSLISTPDKKEVWTLSTLWFALLPLLSPVTLIAAVADTAFYFILGNNHEETGRIYYQYRSALAPLLTWATMYGIYNVKQAKIKVPYGIPAVMLCASCIYFQYTYDLPLNSLTRNTWYTWPQYIADNKAVLKKLPHDVPIAAQDSLLPHVQQRKEMHILWAYKLNDGYRKFEKQESPCGEEYCFWLSYHRKVEYLITDTHQGQNATTLLLDNEKKLDEGLANMQKAGFISLVSSQGKAALWKVNKYPEDTI
ncbi:MAG: DUF2079 domain-containing protein [bacterium]|nr:DUF2079 domain-containing protein [bacterium]